MARDNSKNFGPYYAKKNIGNKGRDAENRRIFNAFRKFAQKLVMDKEVQATHLKKAQEGKLHPSMMQMYHNYAVGRPPDAEQDTVKAVPVRIEHVYPEEKAPVDDGFRSLPDYLPGAGSTDPH